MQRIAMFGEVIGSKAPFSAESILGSLVFFCGGCMDCVLSEDSEAIKGAPVRRALQQATLNKPFMALLPFGEQATPADPAASPRPGWARTACQIVFSPLPSPSLALNFAVPPVAHISRPLFVCCGARRLACTSALRRRTRI